MLDFGKKKTVDQYEIIKSYPKKFIEIFIVQF